MSKVTGHELRVNRTTNRALEDLSSWEDLKLLVCTEVPFLEEFPVAVICQV